MTTPIGRFALSSARASTSSSSPLLPSLSSFARRPANLLHSTSPLASQYRAYASNPSSSTTSPPSPSTSTSPQAFPSDPLATTSQPLPAPALTAGEEMRLDSENQMSKARAQTAKMRQNWLDHSKSADGRRALASHVFESAIVYYHPESWLDHAQAHYLSPMKWITRIQRGFTSWWSTKQEMQRTMGRTGDQQQPFDKIWRAEERRLRAENKKRVLAQVQAAFDKYRPVSIRCAEIKEIEAVASAAELHRLTAKLKDVTRSKALRQAQWARLEDISPPKILSLNYLPILPELGVAQRNMLVRFHYKESITLPGQEPRVAPATVYVVLEQRTWATDPSEWRVKKFLTKRQNFFEVNHMG